LAERCGSSELDNNSHLPRRNRPGSLDRRLGRADEIAIAISDSRHFAHTFALALAHALALAGAVAHAFGHCFSLSFANPHAFQFAQSVGDPVSRVYGKPGLACLGRVFEFGQLYSVLKG
jgi:hypothetical protein